MELKKLLSQELKLDGVDSAQLFALLGVPPKPELGDFSLPCFSLAKELTKSPGDIAALLVKSVTNSPLVERAEVLNGYANFFLNSTEVTRLTMAEFAKKSGKLGWFDTGKGKMLCIDFSSINVAKIPHVGHLANTVIGAAIVRIYERFGYNVKRLNYLGDYGTQFAKAIQAYLLWGKKEDIEKRGVEAMQELYVRINEECEQNKELQEQCQIIFRRMEDKDPEIMQLYEWFKTLSLQEAMKLYEPLNLTFDDWRGECYYSQFTDSAMELLKQKGIARLDNGAYIVDLSEFDLGVVIALRSNGTSTYLTRDVATVLSRYEEYHFDSCIYITGAEQKQYFAQLFKTVELLGHDWKLKHIAHGRLSTPEGRLSSRKGGNALARDILQASFDKAQKVLDERGSVSDDIAKLSREIGIGALSFGILNISVGKDSVFVLDDALRFEGETGPYLQYTHARCCSILKAAGKVTGESKNLGIECFEIVKIIADFENMLKAAFDEIEPSIICRYALSLAGAFNKFYNENRIITDDTAKSGAYVLLTDAVSWILRECLEILGIPAPEKM